MQAAGFIGATGSMILNNSVFGSSTRTGRMYGNNANVSRRAVITAKSAEKLRMKLRKSTKSKRFETYDTNITIDKFRQNLINNKYKMKPAGNGTVENYYYNGNKEFTIRSDFAKSTKTRSVDVYLNDGIIAKIRFFGDKY